MAGSKIAYAKAKPITSLSGCDMTAKHRDTLRKAKALLLAQGTAEADHAARLMTITIGAYNEQIAAWYESDTYRNSYYGPNYSREGAL